MAMDAELAYPVALGAAGMLAAMGILVAHSERMLAALGPPMAGDLPERPSGGSLRRRASARGWPWGPASYGATVVGVVAAGGWIGLRLAGPVGLVAGLVGSPVAVEAALSRRLARARERGEDDLRDAVLALAAGMRSGLSVRRAVEEAAGEAEPPLRDALDRVVSRIDVGEPLDSALSGLGDDLASRDAALLVALLQVHRRSGGDLPSLLDEVAETIRQRAEGRRQIRALTAQGRASGTVLAVLPIAFVTLLSGTSGDGLGAFYRTAQGSLLLVAGLLCDALGFAWIRWIVRPRP